MVEVVFEGDRARLAKFKNVGMAVWFSAPTLHAFSVWERMFNELRQSYPGGIGFYNIVAAGKPSFSSEVRQKAADLVAQTRPQDAGGVHIIMLGGLAGAATRSFLSTMLLMSRNDRPQKVFADLESGAAWLAERLRAMPEPPSAAELVAAGQKLLLPSLAPAP